ncbi:hypothetical protein SAMN04487968_11526 [Nocardioides terrae]|uniref:Uncharacterized protein n=1 Tax=Nocardioides terrae TaxID=574651 RepID=A0A1I1N885_9ACTN|nr:hypothetical protein [Nocardioides terrae]SFC93817.1 hypothetical protein SAMN04487968_11526 [Nocardioides terrae]
MGLRPRGRIPRESQAQPDDTLARINRVAAENAAAVVTFLPTGMASIGVPVEIDRAVSEGKHVILFSDIKASWVLTYAPSAVARYHSWNVDDVADAVAWLDRQQTDLQPPAPNGSLHGAPRPWSGRPDLLPSRDLPRGHLPSDHLPAR